MPDAPEPEPVGIASPIVTGQRIDRRCARGSRTVGVTDVTAVRARPAHGRPLAHGNWMRGTSCSRPRRCSRCFAIALALTGRRAATRSPTSSRRSSGPAQPVNLNAVTNSSELAAAARARRSRCERAPARGDAAVSIHPLAARARRARCRMSARCSTRKTTTTGRPLLTRGDLAAIKPFAIVRTARDAPATGRAMGRDLLASVWLRRRCSGGRAACAATISCWPPRIC